MPGTAVVYDTSTVVTAAPPDDTPVIVATIASVSTGQNFGRVRLFATVNLTCDTDATSLVLRWYRNLIAANVPCGAGVTVGGDALDVANTYVCGGVDVPPAGTHTYNLYATFTDSDSVSAIASVVATAIVGG